MNGSDGEREALVRELYQSILRRDPDPMGLQAYCRLLKDGVSVAQICREMRSSSEFRKGFTNTKRKADKNLQSAQIMQFQKGLVGPPERSGSDFALVNKSYLKDLEWSLYLYASAELYARPKVDYYVVVPKSDMEVFVARFAQAADDGVVDALPNFIIQENLLERLGISVPNAFNGWMTQQVIKLCFGLTGLADNYFVMDSAILFLRHFDWKSVLFDSACNLKTAARPLTRSNRRNGTLRSGRSGWKKGELVNIHESFDFISEFYGECREQTYHYISGTGIFSSKAIQLLLKFIRQKGLEDFAQLIAMAPYECAWYGDFIYQRKPIQFVPTDPDLAWICITEEALNKFASGDLVLDQSAICFQAPIDRRIAPIRAYNLAVRKYGIQNIAVGGIHRERRDLRQGQPVPTAPSERDQPCPPPSAACS